MSLRVWCPNVSKNVAHNPFNLNSSLLISKYSVLFVSEQSIIKFIHVHKILENFQFKALKMSAVISKFNKVNFKVRNDRNNIKQLKRKH